ncbi:Hypothetical protein, putative [Bodo saltans]|uniref:Uncharacterized protein n=1 Tax=Bodo saltans TaxID=75058 RepID=A0A0S4KPX1_BODSA|nr:Hypothetical protein, putative [Bodo saltans]|eukprot:CUI14969.1 Hypothetical protein, putative [Bodo saltans]
MIMDAHDPSNTSPSRSVERAQDEKVWHHTDQVTTRSVNIHAVLHDWAIRDEIRLRAQQQVVADRLERSRQQHIMPPYNHAAMRGRDQTTALVAGSELLHLSPYRRQLPEAARTCLALRLQLPCRIQ